MATATVFVLLGGVALYALASVGVPYVRHVRRERARFAATSADVTALQAIPRGRDHSPLHALGRVDGSHEFVADTGCLPPETPVSATF
jgi:hypothetical protein